MQVSLGGVCHQGRLFMFKDWIGNDLRYKHLYICHVDSYIGYFNPYNGDIDYATSDKFIEFIQGVLEKYPEYSPHNVINYGIQQEIRKKIQEDCVKTVSIFQNKVEKNR